MLFMYIYMNTYMLSISCMCVYYFKANHLVLRAPLQERLILISQQAFLTHSPLSKDGALGDCQFRVNYCFVFKTDCVV